MTLNYIRHIICIKQQINTMNTTSEILKKYGAEIRELRVACKFRLVDVAARSGVSLEAIQKMETGKDFRMSSWIKVMRSLNQDAEIHKPEAIQESLSPLELEKKLRQSNIKRVRVN